MVFLKYCFNFLLLTTFCCYSSESSKIKEDADISVIKINNPEFWKVYVHKRQIFCFCVSRCFKVVQAGQEKPDELYEFELEETIYGPGVLTIYNNSTSKAKYEWSNEDKLSGRTTPTKALMQN